MRINNTHKEITKKEVIDSLYKIMCTNTTSAVDNKVSNNDYFKRRVLGFKAEIEFEKELKGTKFNFMKGGILLSPRLDGSHDMKNKFSYITIDIHNPENYLSIYSKIATWDEIKTLSYAKLDLKNWALEDYEIKENKGSNLSLTKILVPRYKLYKYDYAKKIFSEFKKNDFSHILNIGSPRLKKSSKYHLRKKEHFAYFEKYDLDTLKKIYADRYFLDKKKNENKIFNTIDLDGFIVNEGKALIIEIKEKEPIKPKSKKKSIDTKFWSYGWDTRRLLWYLEIQRKIGFQILYIVRHIENREERNFIKWDFIYLNDFLKGVSWSNSRSGGGGGDTLTAPYNHFSELKELINK